MSETKWTPGEWLQTGGNAVYALSEDQCCNRFYALVQGGWVNHDGDSRTQHNEIAANARLITAAPDLDAALTATLQLLLAFVNPESDDIARAVVEQAKSALAKARGEPA